MANDNPFDETEDIRRKMIADGEPEKKLSESKDKRYNGKDELLKEFEVIGFLAPFVVVRRLSDGKHGTMMFTHEPRVYFNFEVDTGAD